MPRTQHVRAPLEHVPVCRFGLIWPSRLVLENGRRLRERLLIIACGYRLLLLACGRCQILLMACGHFLSLLLVAYGRRCHLRGIERSTCVLVRDLPLVLSTKRKLSTRQEQARQRQSGRAPQAWRELICDP